MMRTAVTQPVKVARIYIWVKTDAQHLNRSKQLFRIRTRSQTAFKLER